MILDLLYSIPFFFFFESDPLNNNNNNNKLFSSKEIYSERLYLYIYI